MRRGVLTVLAILLPLPLPSSAREVSIAIGLSLPPYVLPAEERGMELDIVREALAARGHTLKPVFMPFARVAMEMTRGTVDAAMTINPSSGVQAFYSDPHITYRNVAITLAESGLTIGSIADLAGKTVISFQNSKAYLGPEFKAMADANPEFREEPVQATQNRMLFSKRIQVVIADKNIFTWFSKAPDVQAKVATDQPVIFHELFAPTHYSVAFRDEQLRDDFNGGLAQLRAGGGYGAIVARYGGQ